MDWIKSKKYYQLTGDTKDAVYARLRKGVWIKGFHCKVVAGALWLHLPRIQEWIECSGPAA
jgi:hypothetical protein